MALTMIEVEGMTLGVDLVDGMVKIYTGGEYRGGVRVADPPPPPPVTEPETSDQSLPPGWYIKDGGLFDNEGKLVPLPNQGATNEG